MAITKTDRTNNGFSLQHPRETLLISSMFQGDMPRLFKKFDADGNGDWSKNWSTALMGPDWQPGARRYGGVGDAGVSSFKGKHQI